MDKEYREKTSPVWDMSQERVFIETLLGQRINFFLVSFSAVIAGYINTEDGTFTQLAVTAFGLIIIALLAVAIWRSHHKLDIILKELFSDDSHPAAIINKKSQGFSVRALLGTVMPSLCVAALFFLSVATFIKIITKP